MSPVTTDSQSGQQCSNAGSAPYPSITKAFRDDKTTSSAIEYQADQQFLNRSDLPCSPITMQAFKDDPTSPSMDTDNRSEGQRSYGSDSPYPTLNRLSKKIPRLTADLKNGVQMLWIHHILHSCKFSEIIQPPYPRVATDLRGSIQVVVNNLLKKLSRLKADLTNSLQIVVVRPILLLGKPSEMIYLPYLQVTADL